MNRGWLAAAMIFVVAGSAVASEELESMTPFPVFLDAKSRYGQYWFPEPLRGPEADVDRELRIDWVHSEKRHQTVADEVVAEVEYNIGLLTLELEVPYERTSDLTVTPKERAEGIGNPEIALRHPVYQFVSADGKFDYTLVGAFELAPPSGSEISEDTEFVPKVLQAIRIGEHFSIQTALGYSFRVGSREGGESALEYSATFGWTFEHDELPIPGTASTTPIFELIGERGLSKGDYANNLSGVIGGRFNLHPIGDFQPRLGAGYIFPIDKGARDEADWGIVTSLVFEL